MQAVRTLWSTGDIRGAVDRVAELGDAAVMVDFLAVVSQKYVPSVRCRKTHRCCRSGLLSLDMAVTLLPSLKGMLDHQFEQYISAALQGALMLLRSFGGLIQSTRAAAVGGGGRGLVDVAQEERYTRSDAV